VAPSLRARGNASHRDDTEAYVTVRRATRAHSADDADRWEVADEAGNLNGWDLRHGDGNELAIGTSTVTDDPLLPLGLDSHRYRCCGNGVVASVAEWIGQRLAFA
jgi:site-specific DNA-cytosine methylase